MQFYVLNFLPVISGFYRFFHCPGKSTFCHGKNPTLLIHSACHSSKFLTSIPVHRAIHTVLAQIVHTHAHARTHGHTRVLNIDKFTPAITLLLKRLQTFS